MFCMASEKAPFRNLLREGNAQVTARSESEILPDWAGRMRKFAGSKASRDTCEVSETIARMLLGVNSFLSLSKDNAPVGAPARRLGAIGIVGLSRFQRSASTQSEGKVMELALESALEWVWVLERALRRKRRPSPLDHPPARDRRHFPN